MRQPGSHGTYENGPRIAYGPGLRIDKVEVQHRVIHRGVSCIIGIPGNFLVTPEAGRPVPVIFIVGPDRVLYHLLAGSRIRCASRKKYYRDEEQENNGSLFHRSSLYLSVQLSDYPISLFGTAGLSGTGMSFMAKPSIP